MLVKNGFNAMGWIQCVLALTASAALAQSTNPAAGPEIRAYPAGLIGAARLDVPLGRNGWFIDATAGYNLTRRGDFGRHDDERGGGPGLGIGVDHRFRAGPDGWFAGVRIDWWWLGVDWLDRAPGRSGRTDVQVFQPTGRAGYGWTVFGGQARLEAAAALGAEINASSRGEAVGEGAIFLGGLSLLWRW